MKAGWPGLGWGLPYQVKWYGEVDPLAGLNIGGTGFDAVYASDVCQFRDESEHAEFVQSWPKGSPSFTANVTQRRSVGKP
jgi:hypothetical protein